MPSARQDRRPQALLDVEQAALHYLREAEAVLAEEFLRAVGRAVALASTYPRLGCRRHAMLLGRASLRTTPIVGIPYLVFYEVGADRIEILRVLHTSRDLRIELMR